MSDFFNNEIVHGVLATIIGVIILGVFGWLKFKRDEKIVTRFLKSAKVEPGHAFRSTRAISSAINLSHERIKKVCSKSQKIKRNEKEEDSWRLH